MMTKPDKTGLSKLIASTVYSWQGLRAAWRQEEAFRLELGLAVIFIPVAFIVGDGLAHKLVLVMSCGLVVLAEIVNSAIESVVDRIGPEPHPLSGQAKDLGSAAVFTTLMLWLLLWIPSVWEFFRQLAST